MEEEIDAEEMYQKGVSFYLGNNGMAKDYEKAVEWFSKAAEQGNAKAMRRLGVCYKHGYGVEKDGVTAKEWYAKAIPGLQYLAQLGDADAQYGLGACYDRGEGVMHDSGKAVEWYVEAAEHEKGREQ